MPRIPFARQNSARTVLLSLLFGVAAVLAACRDAAVSVAPSNDPRVLPDRPNLQVSPKVANWTPHFPKPSPSPRSEHSMATSPNGVYLFGGRRPDGFSLGDLWEWNGTSWTLLKLGTPAPPASDRTAMAWDPVRRRLVLAVCGSGTWELNPYAKINPGWVLKASTAPACGAADMTYDETFQEMALLTGQVPFDQRAVPGPVEQWIWNGSEWISFGLFTNVPDLPFTDGPNEQELLGQSGLAFHRATGQLVMCCGVLYSSTFLPPYRPTGATWVGHMGRFVRQPVATAGQTARHILTPYEPGGSLLLLGGSQPLNSGFPEYPFDLRGGFAPPSSWTGTTWVLTQFGFPAPTPRRGATAYDAVRGNIVLFGGETATGVLNDTWTWGKQVACVPLEGAEVPVGTPVECFFKLGTGAQLLSWDADGFAPKRQTTTTARFHPTGPGPAVVRVRWTDEEVEQSTEIRFTIVHRPK